MSRRTRLSLGIVVITAFTLAGCASPPSAPTASTSASSAAPVTITFDSYSYATPGVAKDTVTQLITEFQKQHPNVTVTAQPVATADVLTRAKTETAAGTPPDVVQLGYSKLSEAEQTLPLQSIEKIAGSEWKDATAGLPQAILATGRFRGSVYAMPFTVSIPTLFYNADLFTAAGLDPKKPPTTIAQVASDASRIAATGKSGVYVAIVDPGQSDYLTQSVIDSNGGASVDAKGRIKVDSPQAIAALATVQKLTTTGAQPAVSAADASAAFANGDLGMFIVSTALASQLEQAAKGKFTLKSAAFPRFGAATAAPTFSGAGLVVMSTDRAKKQAAWEFVNFLTSKEAETIITEQIGYLPLRAGIADDAKYLKGFLADNPLLLPPIDQLAHVTPYTSYSGPQGNEATVLLQTKAIEPIVLHGVDPATTLKQVADQMRQLTGSK